LAGTLSEVNSTMREFSSITRGQSAVASQQADNIANLIQLAQQQQEAISGLLSRN
jgi:methyl-accepting chemotaxis protein